MTKDPFASLRALKRIADPTKRAKALTDALNAVPDVQNELRQARQDAVIEMRAEGMSHATVATALGISRARAQQIAEGRASGKRKDPETADVEG